MTQMSQIRHALCLMVSLLLTSAGSVATGEAQGAGGADTVDVDPIRCWWKTSAGAVRVGETFTLALTCAVLETADVQVVPDQSPLAPAVVQIAPFEVVGGTHPEDLRAGLRRFFQYEYTLRVIDADRIGKDVSLPPLSLRYRVNSRVGANAALEGRDHSYVLPPFAIRVLSMVPAEAADIRDGSDASFGLLERLDFRASALSIAALTLGALAIVTGGLTLLPLFGFGRVRVAAARSTAFLGPRAVRKVVSAELAAVQRESIVDGWTASLIERAAAAVRLAGGLTLGRSLEQRPVDPQARSAEGRLIVPPRLRRRVSIALSSAVTAEDLAENRAPRPASAGQRAVLDDLRTALVAFDRASYGEEAVTDREPLDAALAGATSAVGRLELDRGDLRRWLRPWARATAEGQP